MNLSLNRTTARQTKSVYKLVGNIPGNAVLRFLAQVENVDTAHLVEYAVFLGTHFSVIIASSVSLKNELVLVLAVVAVVRVLRLLSFGNDRLILRCLAGGGGIFFILLYFSPPIHRQTKVFSRALRRIHHSLVGRAFPFKRLTQ